MNHRKSTRTKPSAEELIKKAIAAASEPKSALAFLRCAERMVKGETSVSAARVAGLIGYMLYQSFDINGARAKYEESERLWEALPPDVAPMQRAATFQNHANLLADLGVFGGARRRMEAAIAIKIRAGEAESVEHGRTLADYARLLDAQGEAEEAGRQARLAIALLSRGTESRDRLHTLYARNMLGIALMNAGAWGEALDLFKRLVKPVEECGDFSIHYSVVNNIGWALDEMGDHDGAVAWFARALYLIRYRPDAADRVAEATLHTNIGSIHHKHGEYEEACSCFADARAVLERAIPDGRHRQMGSVRVNWGMSLVRLDRLDQAQSQYDQALELRVGMDGEDHRTTAEVRYHIAELVLLRDAADQALKDAVAILASPGLHAAPDLVWRIFDLIARALDAQGRRRLAILFGKQAIDTLETLRLGIVGRGVQAENIFTRSRTDGYGNLADLLYAEGRVAEGDLARERLRAAEQNDLFGRDNGSAAAGWPGYSRQEQEWRASFAPALAKIAELRDAIKREAEEEGRPAELAAIRTELAAAAGSLSTAIAKLTRVRRPEYASAVIEAEPPGDQLQALELGSGEALVHLFPTERHVWVSIRRGDGAAARHRIECPAPTLGSMVAKLRQALTTPHSPLGVTKAASQRLYDVLFRPVLETAPFPRLRFWLDGPLRFIPPAALFDGERYLVERSAIAMHSPLMASGMPRRSLASDGVAGFATRRTAEGFAPLPFAVHEVEAVVGERPGEGLFRGERFLDDRFTLENLAGAASKFGGLLVASHFALRPADLSRSGLMMGTGELMPVSSIVGLDYSGLALAAISGCDTGTAGLDADATILQSLADRLLLRGAGSVLASLWRVADAAGACTVTGFFAALATGQCDFASALARAQLAMLRGDAAALPALGPLRGIGGRLTDGDQDVRHPYFWSPFILVSGMS